MVLNLFFLKNPRGAKESLSIFEHTCTQSLDYNDQVGTSQNAPSVLSSFLKNTSPFLIPARDGAEFTAKED